MLRPIKLLSLLTTPPSLKSDTNDPHRSSNRSLNVLANVTLQQQQQQQEEMANIMISLTSSSNVSFDSTLSSVTQTVDGAAGINCSNQLCPEHCGVKMKLLKPFDPSSSSSTSAAAAAARRRFSSRRTNKQDNCLVFTCDECNRSLSIDKECLKDTIDTRYEYYKRYECDVPHGWGTDMLRIQKAIEEHDQEYGSDEEDDEDAAVEEGGGEGDDENVVNNDQNNRFVQGLNVLATTVSTTSTIVATSPAVVPTASAERDNVSMMMNRVTPQVTKSTQSTVDLDTNSSSSTQITPALVPVSPSTNKKTALGNTAMASLVLSPISGFDISMSFNNSPNNASKQNISTALRDLGAVSIRRFSNPLGSSGGGKRKRTRTLNGHGGLHEIKHVNASHKSHKSQTKKGKQSHSTSSVQ
jgi:hypothetical protein